jgi:hypothetical protein
MVFVHDLFEVAARIGAKALGLPDLAIYVYPQHKANAEEAEEAAKGVKAARDLPRLLTSNRLLNNLDRL